MTTLALTLWPWPPRARLIRGQAFRADYVDAAVRAAYIGQLQDPDALMMMSCASKARSLASVRGWQTRRRNMAGVRK